MTSTPDENTEKPLAASDAELVLRTRSGDAEAFGELWSRHYRSGVTVARSVTARIDPDDLVQEAYARIFQAIRRGGGPNGSFRAYLFTSIRNTAAGWGRANRESPIDELDALPDPDTTEQATDDALDRSLTAQAFRSLPSRWQEVLWYTEIEQMKPREVAPLLGMSVGAVTQLAFRAREGLREAWIQAHLNSAPEDSACHRSIESLGAYARGNLSRRDQAKLEAHLEDCPRCMIVAAEAKDVSSRLALVLLPLVLGVAGAGAYTAALQGGGTPVVALAAMPSGIVDGGVVAAVSTGGAMPMPGGGASGGAAGSGGAAAGTAGGVLSGAGLAVAASVAALAVAGAVAAAAIIPGLTGGSATTALSAASDHSASAPLSAEVDTEPGIEPRPTPFDVLDEPVEDAIRESATPEEPPAPVEDAPSRPGDTGPTPPAPPGEGGGAGSGEPPAPPVEEGGDGDGPEEPGGSEEPEPPTGPAGTPSWNVAEVAFQARWDIVGENVYCTNEYRLPVSGTPGATVRALLNGSALGGSETVLSGSGDGIVLLTPTSLQLLHDDPVVTLQYVDGDAVGEAEAFSIFDLGDPVALQACPIDTGPPPAGPEGPGEDEDVETPGGETGEGDGGSPSDGDPGDSEEPGEGSGGTEEPGDVEYLPLAWQQATMQHVSHINYHARIPLTGTAGATVRATYTSLLSGGSAQVTLDPATGTGALLLPVSTLQMASGDWTVTFSYVDADGAGSTSATFSQLGIAPPG